MATYKEIVLYFILRSCHSDVDDCSADMKSAYNIAQQHNQETVWLTEPECLQGKFDKKHVLIFEVFEGDTFREMLKRNSVSIIGPKVIYQRFLELKPLPSFPNQFFTLALEGALVTTCGFLQPEKDKIKEYVQFMAGRYLGSLTLNTTHLIAKTALSKKFQEAKKMKMKIYPIAWIMEMWESKSTYAPNPETMKNFECGPLHGIEITSTGLAKAVREKVEQLINDNGGLYSKAYQSKFTHVVLSDKPSQSEKLMAARKNNSPCCTLEWLYDSIKHGYALDVEPYNLFKVKKSPALSSTFLDPDNAQRMNLSTSTICGNYSNLGSTIHETVLNVATATPNFASDDLFNMDLKLLRNCDGILDGIHAYFSEAFSGEEKEKINKIISALGAMCYDAISDKITHFIVSNRAGNSQNCKEINSVAVKMFQQENASPVVVTSDWLKECIRENKHVNESAFEVSVPALHKKFDESLSSSQLKDKELKMLRQKLVSRLDLSSPGSSTIKQAYDPVPSINVEPHCPQNKENCTPKTMGRPEPFKTPATNLKGPSFSKPLTKQTPVTNQTVETLADESLSEATNNLLFHNLTFDLSQLNDNVHSQYDDLVQIILAKSGKVVYDSNLLSDYAIVPINFNINNQNSKSKKIVTDIWLFECIESNELLKVRYYHKPMNFGNLDAPLSGLVITLSSYLGNERLVLSRIIKELGATLQDVLSKKNAEGVFKNTHLICPSPVGSKYIAAQKWKLHICNHRWLMGCLRENRRLPEENYPVLDDTNATLSEEDDDISKMVQEAAVVATEIPELQHLKTPSNASKTPNNTSNLPNLNTSSAETPCKKTSFYQLGKKLHFSSDDGNTPKASNQSPSHFNIETSSPRTPASDVFINKPPENTRTPAANRVLNNSGASPMQSQSTPVHKFLENLKTMQSRSIVAGLSMDKLRTPPPISNLPPVSNVDTPQAPLGKVFLFSGDPSPNTKKYWARDIASFGRQTTPKRKYESEESPMSKINRKFWVESFKKDGNVESIASLPGSTSKTSPANEIVNNLADNIPESEVSRFSRCSFFESPGQSDNGNLPNEQLNMSPSSISSPAISAALSTSTPTQKSSTSGDAAGIYQQFENLRTLVSIKRQEDSRRASLSKSDDVDKRAGSPEDEPRFEKLSQACTVGWANTCTDDYFPSIKSNGPIRKFMLSQLPTVEDQQEIAKLIKNLGGEVSSQVKEFDPTATHLLCKTFSRTEKSIAAMVSGKWILHMSYIQHCSKLGKFDNEESFEFGNPAAINPSVRSNDGTSAIPYKTVYEWRRRIYETGKKPYHGMKVLFLLKNKVESYSRLVEAGGGSVLNGEVNEDECTHCFVEEATIDSFPKCKELAARGVKCLKPIFLNDLLLNENVKSELYIPKVLLELMPR